MRATALLLFCCCLSAGCTRAEGTEPHDCNDGADNDGDGRFDCRDDGCSGAPACESQPASDVAATDPAPAPAVEAPEEGEPAPEIDTTPALVAYRTLLTAYRDGDADAYMAGYAPTLRCFHGEESVPRARLRSARASALTSNREARDPRRMRARPLELRVFSSTEDEVELVDYGWTGRGAADEDTIFHQKWIVMARQADGAWRVVVEAPAHRATCGLPVLRETPPPLWSAMKTWFEGLLEACVGPEGATLDDGFPGLGGSIGCDPTSSSPAPEPICAGASPAERSRCIGNARAEIRAFGG